MKTDIERGFRMGRARRARKIAATAAYGGGGLAAGIGAVGALGYGLLKAEAKIARRIVGTPFDGSPDDNGVYGAGVGEPVELVMLGDSSAAGMGCDHRYQTVGAIIATGVSALTGRPVRLTNAAVVGAESSSLEMQLVNALDVVSQPHVAVIMIGANDVTHRIDKAVAVRHLETTVRKLRALGAEVVVGTCPDLGTIEPIPQPLRLIGRRWSRDMAAAQTVAVVEAGGRTVSLGDLLGPEFAERPHEMFSADRFHPSPAGYARAAAALLPSVYAALGVWKGEPPEERVPDIRRGEGIGPVAVAAEHAVRDPGTEVSATEIAGQTRGPRGRWAVLLRRPRNPLPTRSADDGSSRGSADGAVHTVGQGGSARHPAGHASGDGPESGHVHGNVDGPGADRDPAETKATSEPGH
jgi:lysophospholipase L1-like esterase